MVVAVGVVVSHTITPGSIGGGGFTIGGSTQSSKQVAVGVGVTVGVRVGVTVEVGVGDRLGGGGQPVVIILISTLSVLDVPVKILVNDTVAIELIESPTNASVVKPLKPLGLFVPPSKYILPALGKNETLFSTLSKE